MKQFFRRILVRMCAYYTAVTFLLPLIYWILNRDLSKGMQPVALMLILPFSFLFALANVQFSDCEYAKALRILCHYVLTVGGAFLFLYLPNKAPESTPSQGLILFVAFTVLYAVILAAVLLISARVKRVTRDETDYKNVYKK